MGIAVGSCSDDVTIPATQVMVFVGADAALLERATELLVTVDDEAGTEAPQEQRVVLSTLIEPLSTDPFPIAIVPRQGDSTRRYRVAIELLEPVPGVDGETRMLAAQTIAGGFTEDELREVRLNLDESCEYTMCEEGYRCEAGRCIEQCVEPAPEGGTERSGAVTCGEPCTASGCFGNEQVTCENGVRIVEHVCGAGCSDDGTTCNAILPSNVGDLLPSETDLASFVIGTDEIPSIAFGTIDPPSGFEQPLFIGWPSDTTFEFEGFEFQAVDAPGGAGGACDGSDLRYGVYFIDSLHVLEGGALFGIGEKPLILIARGDIRIDGNIAVQAGGCQGGDPTSDGVGQGPGGGEPGLPPSAPSNRGSGGGGASFGGPGGRGGVGAFASVTPGEPGSVYPAGPDQESLVPLLGGSGGGAGDDAVGGIGGGAIQLVSLTGRVLVGESGVIDAGGGGGSAGGLEGGGAGGGSGGSVLIETGTLACPAASDVAHVAAPGGAGGGAGLRAGPGADGDPRVVPAPGGVGMSGGADGSDESGHGAVGSTNSGSPGPGGGGGAGRVRINTMLGTELCDVPANQCGVHLAPTTCGDIAIAP